MKPQKSESKPTTLNIKRFFFYGTLNRESDRRIDHCFVRGFALYTKQACWYPMAMPASKKARVYGALFDYSHLTDEEFEEKLRILDSYEDCPYLYSRVQVEVVLPDGKPELAWIYQYNNSGKTQLQRKWGGNWKLPPRNRTAFITHAPDGSRVHVRYPEYHTTSPSPHKIQSVGNIFTLTLEVDEVYSENTLKLWKLIELWCLQHGAWYIQDEESEPSKWRIRVSQSEVPTSCPKKANLQSQTAGAGVGSEMSRSSTQKQSLDKVEECVAWAQAKYGSDALYMLAETHEGREVYGEEITSKAVKKLSHGGKHMNPENKSSKGVGSEMGRSISSNTRCLKCGALVPSDELNKPTLSHDSPCTSNGGL